MGKKLLLFSTRFASRKCFNPRNMEKWMETCHMAKLKNIVKEG